MANTKKSERGGCSALDAPVRTGKAALRAISFRSRQMVESNASSTRPRAEY
ncbi:unnamed protein product [Brassica oleracea]